MKKLAVMALSLIAWNAYGDVYRREVEDQRIREGEAISDEERLQRERRAMEMAPVGDEAAAAEAVRRSNIETLERQETENRAIERREWRR